MSTSPRTSKSLLVKVWFILALVVIRCIGTASQLLNDDVLGLIVFKADLKDPTFALSSWSEDDDNPCNWTGIKCSPMNGRAIEVNLDGLSLSGRIGRGLVKLEYLRTLSLANNNFSGGIDEGLAQLNGLRKINLSHNVLSGQLPSPLGNMSSLRFLDLSDNLLSGAIPWELFANCRNLRFVSLARNFIQGSIPPSLGYCAGLLGFNFSGNLLTGEIPSGIRALHGLQMIDVSYNSISGAFPLVGSLPNLIDMRLQSNKLAGMISEDLGLCIHLRTLDLNSNLLSGGLPEALQGLQSLSSLNLKGNFLSGSIPPWIGDLSMLETLSLADNYFTGSIPSTVGLLRMLKVLDLSNNRLVDQIPNALSGCAQLSSVDLSGNKFSGTIPQDLFTLDLVLLRLSDNGLTGTIPNGSSNHCRSLRVLDLSQNQLSGGISSQISYCANLEYVNMSGNSFSEGIPGLDQLQSIHVLDLSNNHLTGIIPSSIGEALRLSIFVVNNNSLRGQIPPQIGNCSAMTYLRFSHNNLNGSIPPELGKLNGLALLDLSFNNLSGGIPSELGLLQSLVVVNVSYNQLEGPVPNGGIFNRLNETSFLGNEDLCGADVNVTCPSVLPKPIVLNPNFSGDNSSSANPLLRSRHRRIVLSPSAIIAISAAVLISLGVVIITFLNIREQTRPHPNSHVSDSLSQSPSTDLPIGKLVMFTKSSDPRSEEWVTSAHALLNKDSEVGRGGFGTVYKAVFADGRTVAIKKLLMSSLVKSQEEFEKEVQLLGKIKHRNLVGLQGYYWTPQLQLLIYDFISCGNLYSQLHERSQGDVSLNWPKRFKIAVGTAQGLAHLHHACHPPVIHYNMKSSNVLLDESYNPKIADYGLAKLLSMLDRYIMSNKFQSALGYMAPEFACQSLRINEKCDVYGYGVMLLELVTGRRPVEYMEDDVVILCDHVRSLLDEGKAMSCVDACLQNYAEDEVLPVIKLGLICTSQVPSNRPSMAEVVQILELIKTPGNSSDLP